MSNVKYSSQGSAQTVSQEAGPVTEGFGPMPPPTFGATPAPPPGPGPIFLALLTADATSKGISHYRTTPQNIKTRVDVLLAAEACIQDALTRAR